MKKPFTNKGMIIMRVLHRGRLALIRNYKQMKQLVRVFKLKWILQIKTLKGSDE